MANTDSTTKKLLKQFSIIPQRKKDKTRTVLPATVDRETGNLRPIKFETDIQRQFKEWANDLTTPEELKNRIQRYLDIDFMVQNNGWIGLAAKLYSNETITPNESGKIITVYAKDKKVEQYINTFLESIQINRTLLEATAYDLATKADSFWIRTIVPEDGIVEVVPVSPYQVASRFEFSSVEQLRKETRNFMYSTNSGNISLTDIETMLTDKIKNTDYAANYRKYLFGFGLEENKIILPPWAMTHFRRFSTQSEFAPFGRPLLINSLSLFREYMSSKNLLAMARVASFPKEIFKISTSETMTPVEKIAAVNEARQEYYNLIALDNGREDNAIGQAIWTSVDTFEYELLTSSLDLGEIADVELQREELIASTLVPKGYIINSDGSWGESGKALLQQSKIFAREVFSLQTAILEALYDLIRTQFILTNQFDGYDTEFELQLAYPSSEQSSENLDMQKDTMELAQAVIDNLKTALAIDSLPPDVIKSILHKYAGFNTKELDKWLKSIENSVELEIKQNEFEEPVYMEKLNKALSRLSESVFRESYFSAKKNLNLREGVLNNKHFYSSGTLSFSEKIKYEMMINIEKDSSYKKLHD